MVEILISIEEEKKITKKTATDCANGRTFTSPGAGGNNICVTAEISKNDDPIGADVTPLAALHHNKFL